MKKTLNDYFRKDFGQVPKEWAALKSQITVLYKLIPTSSPEEQIIIQNALAKYQRTMNRFVELMEKKLKIWEPYKDKTHDDPELPVEIRDKLTEINEQIKKIGQEFAENTQPKKFQNLLARIKLSKLESNKHWENLKRQ